MSHELVLWLYSFDVIRNLKESFRFYLEVQISSDIWIIGNLNLKNR